MHFFYGANIDGCHSGRRALDRLRQRPRGAWLIDGVVFGVLPAHNGGCYEKEFGRIGVGVEKRGEDDVHIFREIDLQSGKGLLHELGFRPLEIGGVDQVRLV